MYRVYTFDLERLNGVTNGDNGFTILNSRSGCIPKLGSLDPNLAKVHPNEIQLNSGLGWGRSDIEYCTFALDANSGEIRISMENMPTNQWAREARNGHTYAENTRDFLKGYVIVEGPTNENRSRKKAALEELRTLPPMGVFPGGIEFQEGEQRFQTLQNTIRNTKRSRKHLKKGRTTRKRK